MIPESGDDCNTTGRAQLGSPHEMARSKRSDSIAWQTVLDAVHCYVRANRRAFAEAGRWLDTEYSEAAIRERRAAVERANKSKAEPYPEGRVSPYQIIPPEEGRDARLACLTSVMVDLRNDPPDLSSFEEDRRIWAHRVLLVVCLLTDCDASEYTAGLTGLGGLPWEDRGWAAKTGETEPARRSDLERGDKPWATMAREALRLVTADNARRERAHKERVERLQAIRQRASESSARKRVEERESRQRCIERATLDAAKATPAEQAAVLRMIADELENTASKAAAIPLLLRAFRFGAFRVAAEARGDFEAIGVDFVDPFSRFASMALGVQVSDPREALKAIAQQIRVNTDGLDGPARAEDGHAAAAPAVASAEMGAADGHVPVPADNAWLSETDLAIAFGVNQNSLRAALRKWRPHHHANEWQTVPNPKPRDPRFLYRVGAVKPVIQGLQKRTGESPAKVKKPQ